jgi:predicted nucleic acid-binding protein
MILVDTSVIVAWLDGTHEDHRACAEALEHLGGQEQLAVSAVTFPSWPRAEGPGRPWKRIS